jgi:hypothetical protein
MSREIILIIFFINLQNPGFPFEFVKNKIRSVGTGLNNRVGYFMAMWDSKEKQLR